MHNYNYIANIYIIIFIVWYEDVKKERKRRKKIIRHIISKFYFIFLLASFNLKCMKLRCIKNYGNFSYNSY